MSKGAVALVMVLALVSAGPAWADDVASVGATSVSTADVALRLATERAYGSADADEVAALVSLVGDAVEAEAARRAGQAPTASELQALGRHVDASTQAPAVLARVKAVFGADQEAYARLYLAPRLVNGKLRAWYAGTPAVQVAARARAETVLAQVKGGATMAAAASVAGLSVTRVAVTLPPGTETSATGAPTSPAFQAVLGGLGVGQVHPALVEDGSTFQIVRLATREQGLCRAEVIAIQKRRFDAWLREQAGASGLRIPSAELRLAIQARYPGLWWVALVAE